MAGVCANACSADQVPCAAMGEARVCVIFLRSKIRHKDGKDHRAWSVVENRRIHDGRAVQRQVGAPILRGQSMNKKAAKASSRLKTGV
jgi:hypothetical protein